MLTERDQKIIQFIETVGVASIKQIQKVFFKSKQGAEISRRRMNEIIKYSKVKRSRNSFANEYVYYINSYKYLNHALAVTDFYIKLLEYGGEIKIFNREFKINNSRSDAFIRYHLKDKAYLFFLEVHFSNAFNMQKYIDIYNSREWVILGTFPRLVIYTDKDIKIGEVPFKVFIIKKDENIDSIFHI
ncbi:MULTISPECIES: replication-relaxation family protein [Thermoanaerobacterium]|uniref:replication-relaxation family protein n=1 Tax=Thermoanaerobacterium TaxID=28895 RepID=UPI0002EBB315|nr:MULTISPECIES: replication-relaxation family protein [Thermoanaerobacterium]